MNKLLIAIFIYFSYQSAIAEIVTAKVTGVGCHNDSAICFALIDKTAGVDNCRNTSIRWEGESDTSPSNSLNANKIFSALMLAQATGQYVTFSTSKCFSLQPEFPAIDWLYIGTSH